jgi:predicted transposase YbfD/YdcC
MVLEGRQVTGDAMWVRGHWSIEDRSHQVRDVILGEDASRIRKIAGPQLSPRRAGLDRRILRKMMKSEEIQATFLPIVQIV